MLNLFFKLNKRIKIYLSILFISVFCSGVFTQCYDSSELSSGKNDGNDSEEFIVDFNSGDTAVSKDKYGNIIFSGKNFQYLSNTGEPDLPYEVVKVLLPPEADITTISVSLRNEKIEQVKGTWDIKPVKPAATWDNGKEIVCWPEDKTIVDGKDVNIYNVNSLFPGQTIRAFSTGSMRKWKIADVQLALFRYNPATRKLFKLKAAELSINFNNEPVQPGSKSARIFGDTLYEHRVRDIVVNFENFSKDYESLSQTLVLSKGFKNGTKAGYVIITTNYIKNNSTSLAQFIQKKTLRLFNVYVITEDQWGGGTGDEAAENIRAWLRNNYDSQHLNIEYVLLIGNPNPATGDVPMKMLWPRHNAATYTTYREAPSDYYYADLTGNWDIDGDGYFGEWDDDFTTGGVDTNYEVIIGRIPYYGSISNLDNILQKTISYMDEGTTTWRKNVLLPMKPSDTSTPGYQLGEAIKNNILTPRGWSYSRVYDSNYNLNPAPEYTPCSIDNVVSAWTGSQFGAVFWWTHGNETTASHIMDTSNALLLNNNFPSFTFQCSCLNSYPEYSGNLTYSLLKNGGIVTTGATRVSWYHRGQTEFAGTNTNSGITYEYAVRLIINEMSSGYSLNNLKQSLTLNDDYFWMNYCVFNIYGDPELQLVGPYNYFYDTPCLIPGQSATCCLP